MTLPIPTEEHEQIVLVQWLEFHGYKFSAIPNSTYTTSIKQKIKNKRTGLRAGLPDLLIIVNGSLVFIELKRQKGGVTSPQQKAWIEALNQVGNVQAFVAHGADEAIRIVDRYSAKPQFEVFVPPPKPQRKKRPRDDLLF